MLMGSLEGLINSTEQVVFDHEVTGSAVSSISTGNILNGDEDGWYTIIVRFIAGANTGAMRMRPNGDSGNNYGGRGIVAENSTISDTGVTGVNYFPAGYCTTAGQSALLVSKMYAKSGSVRLLNIVWAYSISGTTVTAVRPEGFVWNNTTDNITSMTFASGIGATDIGVGTRIIILKSNNFTNGTPTGVINTPYIQKAWVRVGSQVLGSAASSVTFSGLDGDTAVCYYLSSQVKAAGVTGGILRINADSGNNYGHQRIQAESTSISAERGVVSQILGAIGAGGTAGYCGFGYALIFAKKGFLRPTLCSRCYNINGTTVTTMELYGNSWNNTADNITSLTITKSAAGDFDTGSQFDLYALYK